MFVVVVVLRYQPHTSYVVLITECHNSHKHSQSPLTTMRTKTKCLIQSPPTNQASSHCNYIKPSLIGYNKTITFYRLLELQVNRLKKVVTLQSIIRNDCTQYLVNEGGRCINVQSGLWLSLAYFCGDPQHLRTLRQSCRYFVPSSTFPSKN